MKYFSKEIIIPIAVIIAIVCLVYMDTNTIIAIASVFIAGCALWVSMRADKRNEMQARLSNERIEKHNKLSVLPLLVCHKYLGEKITTLRLVNSGVGPAIITKIELLFDGKVVSCNNEESYTAFLEEEIKHSAKPGIGYIYAGEIMSVGYKHLMWELRHGKKEKDINFIRKLSLRVEYESIYHDKMYVFDSRDDFKTYDVKSK